MLKDLENIILAFAGPTHAQLHKLVMEELDNRLYIATRFYKNPRRFGTNYTPYPFYLPARDFWVRRVFGRHYVNEPDFEFGLVEWLEQWQEMWLDQRTRWAERIYSAPNTYGVIPFTWALGPHELNLRDWTLWEDY